MNSGPRRPLVCSPATTSRHPRKKEESQTRRLAAAVAAGNGTVLLGGLVDVNHDGDMDGLAVHPPAGSVILDIWRVRPQSATFHD